MKCPKCHSENISFQVTTETRVVRKHHSLLWWIPFGFIWTIIKWVFFTIFALLAKLWREKEYVVKSQQVSMAVCQDCGYTWTAHRGRLK